MKKLLILSIVFLNFIFVGNVSAGDCFDTDSGKNYFVKGTVIYDGNKYMDICLDDVLYEYYCSVPIDEIKSVKMTCVNGCENGACLKSPLSRVVNKKVDKETIENIVNESVKQKNTKNNKNIFSLILSVIIIILGWMSTRYANEVQLSDGGVSFWERKIGYVILMGGVSKLLFSLKISMQTILPAIPFLFYAFIVFTIIFKVKKVFGDHKYLTTYSKYRYRK